MTIRFLLAAALISAVAVPAFAHDESSALPRSPLGQNAALGYWKAFALMPDIPIDEVKAPFADQGTVDDTVRELAQRGTAAVEALRRATQTDACDWGHDWSEGWMLTLPHCSQARKLTFLACLHARVAAADGDAETAIDDLAAATRLARDVGAGGTAIELVNEVAFRAIVIEQAKAIAAGLTAEQSATLLARIEAVQPTMTPADAIAIERDMTVPYIHSLLRARTLQETMQASGELDGGAAVGVAALDAAVEQTQREALTRYATVLDEMAAAARLPHERATMRLAEIEADLRHRAERLDAVWAEGSEATKAERTEATLDTLAVSIPLAASQLYEAAARTPDRIAELRDELTKPND